MSENNIPYFEDEESKLQPGLVPVERKTVNVLLWNSDRDEVLCLDWEKFGWKTFVIGGIEDGEQPEQAALRELAEETGYLDVELVAGLGQLRSGYYAAHKKENRIAHTTGLLFKLRSNKSQPIADAASQPHTPHWIARSGVSSYLTLSSQKYLWEKAHTYLE